MKTWALIKSTLKGFVRDWKAVLLLVVFPLLLISSIFISFNPDGLQTIPVGVIVNEADFEINEFEDVVSSFLTMTMYKDLNSCIGKLKDYDQYVCVEIVKENAYILNLHFDNTKEPVIWQIIERIKSAVDFLQKQKSKEIATDFLSDFRYNIQKVTDLNQDLTQANKELDYYVSDVDDYTTSLINSRNDLDWTLDSMQTDLNGLISTRNNINNRKNNFYSTTKGQLYNIESQTVAAYGSGSSQHYAVTGAQNQLLSYNNEVDNEMSQFDNKLFEYQDHINRGRGYSQDMGIAANNLGDVRNDLIGYKSQIGDVQKDMDTFYNDMSVLLYLDPETLVNPIVVRNKPVYIPEISEEFLAEQNGEDVVDKAVKGLNLISLQTLFPTILLLITLFLSLLISAFICLRNINSSANSRINTIKGMFFPEFWATYISSMAIILVPVICVLLLGQFLFQIHIFENFLPVAIVLFLLSTVFVFIGMTLSYLIRKESMTILITTFLLVSFMFFSGFLLPIERMSTYAFLFASNFPAKLAANVFSRVVFYSQGLGNIYEGLVFMIMWAIALFILAITIKEIRKRA